MKSETNQQEQIGPNLPAFFENTVSKMIVLFDDEYSGMPIANTSSEWRIGEYCTTFRSCITDDIWKRLPAGTRITLVQE